MQNRLERRGKAMKRAAARAARRRWQRDLGQTGAHVMFTCSVTSQHSVKSQVRAMLWWRQDKERSVGSGPGDYRSCLPPPTIVALAQRPARPSFATALLKCPSRRAAAPARLARGPAAFSAQQCALGPVRASLCTITHASHRLARPLSDILLCSPSEVLSRASPCLPKCSLPCAMRFHYLLLDNSSGHRQCRVTASMTCISRFAPSGYAGRCAACLEVGQ